jgi:hypothetical protein
VILGKRMIAGLLSILLTGIGILDFVMPATTELTLVQKVTGDEENYMSGAMTTLVTNIMPGLAHQCFGLKLNNRLCCLR